MQENTEIWQAANLLIHQVGEDAPVYASRWARELLEAGDIEGRVNVNWMRVMVACKALLSRSERG
jgi:hypothetical protein